MQEKISQKEMMKNLCNTLFLGVMEKIQKLDIDQFTKTTLTNEVQYFPPQERVY